MTVDTTFRARIVGELACQKHPYLQTLNVVVISCVEMAPPKPAETAPGKKDKMAENPAKNLSGEITPSLNLWEIEFSDSVLFREGPTPSSHHHCRLPLTLFRRWSADRSRHHCHNLIRLFAAFHPDYICSTPRSPLRRLLPSALAARYYYGALGSQLSSLLEPYATTRRPTSTLRYYGYLR
jgi:hypothetical protein